MKTIDEVINKLEDARVQVETGTGYWVDYRDNDDLKADALHYLKHLQEYYEMSREHHEPNPALSWDELKKMVGKPVWVEALLYKQWAIIAYVGDEHIRFEGVNLYAPECRIYMGEDNGWQAYRKERMDAGRTDKNE